MGAVVGGLDFNIIKDVGAIGILLLVILMIARGTLVPKRTVDSLLEGQKTATEVWRHAAEQREQALAETIPLLESAVKNHETVVKIVTGMKNVIERLDVENSKGGEHIAQALAKEDREGDPTAGRGRD